MQINDRKLEKKLISWMFSWREGEDEKLVESMRFPSKPTKILSLQFREKIEEREIVAIND